MASRVRGGRSNLFMVRVWPEDVGDGRVEWRGKVQRVLNGETLYFHDWQTMLAFLMVPSDSLLVPQKGQEEGQG